MPLHTATRRRIQADHSHCQKNSRLCHKRYSTVLSAGSRKHYTLCSPLSYFCYSPPVATLLIFCWLVRLREKGKWPCSPRWVPPALASSNNCLRRASCLPWPPPSPAGHWLFSA